MFRIILVGLLIIFYCSVIFGVESMNNKDSSTVFKENKVLYLSQWNVSEDLSISCDISEKDQNPNSLPTKTFSCYKKSDLENINLFSFDTPDHPVSMFQLKDIAGPFFTIWTSGSSYHFYVLAFINGKIEKVLETGSKSLPEFIMDSNGEDIVIINDIQWIEEKGQLKPTGKSILYKWDGNGYKIIKETSLDNRFK
jgi:hypothetical protein